MQIGVHIQFVWLYDESTTTALLWWVWCLFFCNFCSLRLYQLFFRPIKGNEMDKDSRVNQILHTTSSKSQRKFEKFYFPLNFQESHYFPLSNLRGDEKTTFCKERQCIIECCINALHHNKTIPSQGDKCFRLFYICLKSVSLCCS